MPFKIGELTVTLFGTESEGPGCAELCAFLRNVDFDPFVLQSLTISSPRLRVHRTSRNNPKSVQKKKNPRQNPTHSHISRDVRRSRQCGLHVKSQTVVEHPCRAVVRTSMNGELPGVSGFRALRLEPEDANTVFVSVKCHSARGDHGAREGI
ncbi:hypothetical protein BDM02DRAFT_3125767 [Thelephora ganbajun]|uniref:Uncharacterized protein n=1 Tax=Thelephora ganbajun TaxID=370292 RepID=A0ACB6ZUW1_THEGA|nr:hypothetical protein BDM02DRAFT_3125767 [Thelephora ganbajun]